MKKAKNKLTFEILRALWKNPLNWHFGEHKAIYKKLDIWIANRPYADLTIESAGKERIRGYWNRKKIRNAMSWAKSQQIMKWAGFKLDKIKFEDFLKLI
jgi:hypothetical protein